MEAVLAVLLASLALGVIGVPLAAVLLRRLPDMGAGLALPLGLLAVSLPYFLLRVADVLPPGRGGYLIAAGLAGAGAAFVARHIRWRRADRMRLLLGIVIAASVYSGAFLAYTAFRSYNPEIAGTEQPMDLLFLNATLTSPEYPPRDPWLAGEPVSYYYFGYLQIGVLTAISGVPSSVGYNLGLAATFAAAASGLVSVAWALARWALPARARRYAAVAPAAAIVLVLFAGSLSAVFEWAAAHERYNEPLYRAFGVDYLLPCEPGTAANCYAGPAGARTSAWYPTEFWFWWRGSRVIPGTITEFPSFSFLLGDLHPHVMALPLVTLATGIALALWRGRTPLTWRRARARPWEAAVLGASFGALAFQNAWDVITFSALLALAVIGRNARLMPVGRALAGAAAFLALAGAAALALYAPWWLTFSSQASGLLPYVGEGTRPAHAFLQFGVPGLAAALLLAAFPGRARLGPPAVAAGWVAVVPFVGWVAFAAARGDLAAGADARGAGGWVTLAVLGLAAWSLGALALTYAVARRGAAPAAALAALGFLLLYGAELFFVRDVFYGSVPRLNTVFKLSYQAWLLLGIAGAVAISGVVAAAASRGPRYLQFLRPAVARVALLPLGLLVGAGLVYPLLAVFNRTEGFSRPTAIDGLAWLQASDPDEYALTRWVAAQTPPGAVVIEATGRRWAIDAGGNRTMVDANVDYTDAGRIASRTGRQAPIGWYFHEIQWRGDSEANRSRLLQRQDAVDSAYLTTSPDRVVSVMRDFGADYLVVGAVELARYPGPFPDYDTFLDRVFESGRYRVYRLPEYRPVSAP